MKKEFENRLYDHKRYLINIRDSLSTSFDKYLLMYSTGSLYLSILYTLSLSKVDSLSNIKSLSWGWISFVVAIIFTLLSMFFSMYSYEREISITEDMIYSDNKSTNTCNHWNGYILFTSIIGVVGFIAGIILLSFFYFTNIK